MSSKLFSLGIFLAYFALLSNCHFVLQIPTSIGYDDANEGVAPCGNFDPTSRVGGPTSWPVGGSAISVITTHTSVTWDIKAALVNDTTNWVQLVPVLTQTRVGFFCAAIQFASGGPASTPSSCFNSSAISAHW
ncbi:hypothetical protein BGZ60DRAFT_533997 [Tricladium varicosporioides]|nr:hypothetical protein BGZ60DRAFT_533997 [Hymenoscyphus varicosporioides]